jgi:hypothetical protein
VNDAPTVLNPVEKMMRKTIRTLTVVSLLAAPLALAAQGAGRRPASPGGPGGPGAPDAQLVRRGPQLPGVTQSLNARRVLDLSPRQVAQLDSIERALFTERRAVEQRARALTDSVRTATRARAEQTEGRASDAQRDSIRESVRESVRTRMQTLRPQMERLRARDSVSRAAALRVLNDAQRQQLREIQAEERGRQRGMMEARMRQRGGAMRPGARGTRGMRGARGNRPGN